MLAEQQQIKKEVNTLYIEPKDLNRYWSLVQFMLAEGLKYDGHPMSLKHIKEGVLLGELQLFMMFGSDDGEKYKVFGCFVTRIQTLPNYKQVEVLLLKEEREVQIQQKCFGFSHLEELVSIFDALSLDGLGGHVKGRNER